MEKQKLLSMKMNNLRGRILVGWKIWYANGVVIDSRFNKWEDCPQLNVQIVKMFYRNSDGAIETNEHHGQEYYLLDDLLEVPKTIKIGKAMNGENYYKLLDNANDDIKIVEEMLE